MWSSFVSVLRVGFLLGLRQLQRASRWATVLIIGVMMLTYLNVVVISGILVGLIEGSVQANRQQYTGDVIIEPLADEVSIQETSRIIQSLEASDLIESYVVRNVAGAQVEANYQTRRDFSTEPNQVGTSLVGIDPEDEESVTNISNYVVEGRFLRPDDVGKIVIGSTLMDRYSDFSDLFEPLRDVQIGDRVKVKVAGAGPVELGRGFNDLSGNDGNSTQRVQEFVVVGVVDSKVDEISVRMFVSERDYLRMTGATVLNAEEIAIIAADGVAHETLRDELLDRGFGSLAKVRTANEAIPQFLDTIKLTFGLLGNVIGSIGIVVASITIFIVIYINALTRQKYIGILKAIGIDRHAIEVAYVIQGLTYAFIGVVLGALIVFFGLVPLFEKYPINFPFSDGILVATVSGSILRGLLVLFVTAIAAYIPAYVIAKKNTLDSIRS